MHGEVEQATLRVAEAHLFDIQVRDGLPRLRDRIREGIRGGSQVNKDPALRAIIVACNDSDLFHSLSAMLSDGPSSIYAQEITGLLIDTGCSRASTGSLRQYEDNFFTTLVHKGIWITRATWDANSAFDQQNLSGSPVLIFPSELLGFRLNTHRE